MQSGTFGRCSPASNVDGYCRVATPMPGSPGDSGFADHTLPNDPPVLYRSPMKVPVTQRQDPLTSPVLHRSPTKVSATRRPDPPISRLNLTSLNTLSHPVLRKGGFELEFSYDDYLPQPRQIIDGEDGCAAGQEGYLKYEDSLDPWRRDYDGDSDDDTSILGGSRGRRSRSDKAKSLWAQIRGWLSISEPAASAMRRKRQILFEKNKAHKRGAQAATSLESGRVLRPGTATPAGAPWLEGGIAARLKERFTGQSCVDVGLKARDRSYSGQLPSLPEFEGRYRL